MLFPRAHLMVLLTLFGLAACSDSTSNTPDTPAPPAEPELTALVVGDADSPFLDVLGERAAMTPDDGSQKVADHDLVIFDGDTHTPAALAEHPRLGEAMKAGTWVLVADATEAHKQQGTEPSLGFATQNDADAFVFRSVSDDLPVFDVAELPPVSTLQPDAAPVSDELAAQLQESYHRKFVDRLIEKVGGGTATQQSGGCASPLNIQSGILYATWCYSPGGTWNITSVGDGNGNTINANDVINGQTVQPQTGENDVTYTFTLLLDNQDDVTGNAQWLHVATNGQAAATTTTTPAGINNEITGQPYLMSYWFLPNSLAVGYVQTKLEVNVGPTGTSASLLSPVGTFAPQTPNNAQTSSYTSGTSLTVGATLNAGATPTGPTGGGGVKGSYTVSSSSTQSRTITDWSWTADANGDNGASYDWVFFSQNPLVGSFTVDTIWGDDWASPNSLSLRLLGYGTEAIWKTSMLLKDTVTFQLSSEQQLANIAFLPITPGIFVDGVFAGNPQDVSIDLGTVIPVTLEPTSLTFKDSAGNAITQANPASAGETVTGTVTLTGPAPFSYSITSLATSLNDNAVITESPVRITKGDTSKTFTIETNENGLTLLNETVAVDIFLGSFGSTAAQQLWIVND